jgi:hypothetical protein
MYTVIALAHEKLYYNSNAFYYYYYFQKWLSMFAAIYAIEIYHLSVLMEKYDAVSSNVEI